MLLCLGAFCWAYAHSPEAYLLSLNHAELSTFATCYLQNSAPKASSG